MKRVYRYRGICLEEDKSGKWVYGYFFEDKLGNAFIKSKDTLYKVDKDTVSEYSGAKAINKENQVVDAYEGDVFINGNRTLLLRFYLGGFQLYEISKENNWKPYLFAILTEENVIRKEFVLIGNIYEMHKFKEK